MSSTNYDQHSKPTGNPNVDAVIDRTKRTVDETLSNVSVEGSIKKVSQVAQQVGDNLNDPLNNPVRVAQRTAEATRNVVSSRTNGRSHSVEAQKLVMVKGIFDVFLSLSLVFFPSLLYDGPLTKAVSAVTTLPTPSWELDTGSAYGLASLIMGAGVAGICAGESASDDAYKIIATLNGVFAATGLLGCIFSPHKFGSSFLLVACLQDVFWFTAITKAGNYGVLDTLGLSTRSIQKEHEKLLQRDRQQVSKQDMRGLGKSVSETNEGFSNFGDYKTTKIN
jgi:hypothetical protein